MDGSDFDAMTRGLAAPLSRRVTLGGLLVSLGLASGEAVAFAKKKGKGNKKTKKRKVLCTAAGTSCTFSVHPCCGDTLCCDPGGTGFRTCVPRDHCCVGDICSSGGECSVNCTCQDRDAGGFGTCQPA